MRPNTWNGPQPDRPRSISRHSDPSMGTNVVSGTFSPYRPHSHSHLSDPGDPRYLNSAPDNMVPGISFHHAVSTPDLRLSGRDSPFLHHHHHPHPAKDMSYHYGNPDYHHARARDFPIRPEREMEGRGLLASRSLSDLSNLGNEAFLSHSPTSPQRTFVYPNHEAAPGYAKTFYLQSDDNPAIYNGEYRLRSSGSVPDLSATYPPFRSPYYNPHSGRASPTPSQFSDYSAYSSYTTEPSPHSPFMQSCSRLSENGFSPNESNYSTLEKETALGIPRCERNSSREPEYLRSNSDSPSGFGKGQSPSTYKSVEYSSSRSKMPTYKSSTQQSSLQGSDFKTRDEGNRTSNDGGRERSSTLSRTLSMSNLGNEKKQSFPKNVSEKRRESLPLSVSGHREKYPLANVPIPSFREFKQKKVEKDSKINTLVVKKEAQEEEATKSPKTKAKHDSKGKGNTRATLKERLSSLYESSKDISAQNATKRLSESYKLNSSGNLKKEEGISIAKSTELTEAKRDDSNDVNEVKTSRKFSRSRQDSPFSKNEVIHQLMLKYGLYEKGGKTKAGSPKNERKEVSSSNTNSDAKEIKDVEVEKNWRNSTNHSNRSSPRSSPLSMRKNTQGITTESKKSAAERFRELRRKNGIRNDIVESSLEAADVASKRDLMAVISNEKPVMEKTNIARQNDLDSSMADIIRARTLAVKSKMAADETSASQADKLNANPDSPSKAKNTFSLRGTSRAILCASKFKKAASKGLNTPDGSPLPNRKQLTDIIGKSDVTTKVDSHKPETNETANTPTDTIGVKPKKSPRTRRKQFREDRSLRRGGIHTSMLSVASGTCSDTEMEDTVSICSEMDLLDDERGTRGRRWESFHSNASADSGSAHLFEYETDSNATEYDEVFEDPDSGGETLC